MSPAWPGGARASRRLALSGRKPRWVRSVLRRQSVAPAIAALEAWPGMALALPQVAADAPGAAARARALADRAAATARRMGRRRGRMVASEMGFGRLDPAAARSGTAMDGSTTGFEGGARGKGAGMAAAAILDVDGTLVDTNY